MKLVEVALNSDSSCLDAGAEPEIFVWRPSCNVNIFIKTTPHTHIYIYIYIYTYTCFFYYIHTLLYLISYIRTHPTTKKSLVFSIKIMFDSYLS